MKVNINNYVKVKLTNYGLNILKSKHKEFEQLKTDKEGYTEFQLWELMNIFGAYMYLSSVNLPFEHDIEIKEVI